MNADAFGGVDDARRRIAAALDVNPRQVKIPRGQLNAPGMVFHCRARCNGARYFAKVYLCGSNPPFRRIPAFVSPQGEAALLREPTKPFGGSAGAEWNMMREIQALVGDSHIPRPEGVAAGLGTLVLEEIHGARMDRYTPWSGWNRGRLLTCARVLCLAGAWLRKLHDASVVDHEELQAHETERTVGEILRLKGLRSTRFAPLALAPLEDACREIAAAGDVRVPVCIQHGDFSLPNLVWDTLRQRLWVIDLEHSTRGSILHDLSAITFNLQSQLLYPWRSASVVASLEEAFWAGYGPVSEPIRAMVHAIATARVFYHLLPKLTTRRQRRGWLAGATAAAYIRLLEPAMVRRILAHGA